MESKGTLKTSTKKEKKENLVNKDSLTSLKSSCSTDKSFQDNICFDDYEKNSVIYSVSTLSFDTEKDFTFDLTPSLFQVPQEKLLPLFATKCKQCEQIIQFGVSENQKFIKQKTQLLTEILRAVNDTLFVSRLTLAEYSCIYHLFCRNVFRAPSQVPNTWYKSFTYEPIVDQIQEISWPHISFAYSIVISLWQSPKFNAQWCVPDIYKISAQILQMFKSPDERERQMVSKFFITLYKTFPNIRNELKKRFVQFLDASSTIGTQELLTSFAAIVSTFQLPFSLENRSIFLDSILPLHRSSYLLYFHNEYISLIKVFLIRDPDLIVHVFNSLIKYWPESSMDKLNLYILEIHVYLEEFLKSDNSDKYFKPFSLLLSKLGQSLEESIYSVVDRALSLFESSNFIQVLNQHPLLIYSILLPPLFKISFSFWSLTVREHILNTLHILKSSNEDHFNTVAYKIKVLEAQKTRKDSERAKIWEGLMDEYYKTPEEINHFKSELSIAFNNYDYDSDSLNSALPKIKSTQLKRNCSRSHPLQSTGNITIKPSGTSGSILPVIRPMLQGSRKLKDRISNSKSLPSSLKNHLIIPSNHHSFSIITEESNN